jgi:hypothetical protein
MLFCTLGGAHVHVELCIGVRGRKVATHTLKQRPVCLLLPNPSNGMNGEKVGLNISGLLRCTKNCDTLRLPRMISGLTGNPGGDVEPE